MVVLNLLVSGSLYILKNYWGLQSRICFCSQSFATSHNMWLHKNCTIHREWESQVMFYYYDKLTLQIFWKGLDHSHITLENSALIHLEVERCSGLEGRSKSKLPQIRFYYLWLWPTNLITLCLFSLICKMNSKINIRVYSYEVNKMDLKREVHASAQSSLESSFLLVLTLHVKFNIFRMFISHLCFFWLIY